MLVNIYELLENKIKFEGSLPGSKGFKRAPTQQGFDKVISLRSLLEKFSSLLVHSWENLSLLSESDQTGSLTIDWLQANWELLVEGLVGQGIFLEIYGEGADCIGASSRVLYPDRLPTHQIICKPLQGSQIYDVLNDQQLDGSTDIIFDRFVSLGDDGWYYELPPFDKILANYNGEDAVLDFSEIDFQLKKIV